VKKEKKEGKTAQGRQFDRHTGGLCHASPGITTRRGKGRGKEQPNLIMDFQRE